MKIKLFFLVTLLAIGGSAFAQSWSGQSSSDGRVVPPYRFCLGSDNGQDVCLSQNAANIAKITNGSLDFAMVSKTVATLPPAASNTGRVYRVTDGTSATDCTTGGGSTSVVCYSNGAVWTGLGGGGTFAGGTVAGATVFSSDVMQCGQNISNDVRCKGARGVGSVLQTTITINSGSQNGTIGSSSQFLNNDYGLIIGAGPANTMTTPGAPIVTPSLAKSPPFTGHTVASATGSTSYNYVLVGMDTQDGKTPAGTATSISNGQATLGLNTVSITSSARSGQVVTVTSSAHTLPIGCTSGPTGTCPLIVTTGSTDATFSFVGFVDSVPDATHFTYTQGISTAAGGTTSSTGGTLYYYSCNHISWSATAGVNQMIVYGRSGSTGSLTYIGMSRPGELYFDDYGSTFMAGFPQPLGGMPTNPPAAAVADYLSVQITAGLPSTAITVSPAATTSVTSAPFFFDDGPPFAQAFTAAGTNATAAQVRIGAIAGNLQYVITSNQTFGGAVPITVEQAAQVNFAGTETFNNCTTWNGNAGGSSNSAPAFAWNNAPILALSAYPSIVMGSICPVFDHLAFQISNQGLGIVTNGTSGGGGFNTQIKNSSFAVGSAGGNYVGQAFLGYGITNNTIDHSLMSSSGPSTTYFAYTPLVEFKNDIPNTNASNDFQMGTDFCIGQGFMLDDFPSIGGFGRTDFEGFYCQALRGPALTFYTASNPSIYVNGFTNDTSNAPALVNLGTINHVELHAVENGGTEAGGYPGVVTGYPIGSLKLLNSPGVFNSGENVNFISDTSSAGWNAANFTANGSSGAGYFCVTGLPCNVGSAVQPMNAGYMTNLTIFGSIIFNTAAPIIWTSVEGSCTGAASGKDALCIGGSTGGGYATNGLRASYNNGSFFKIPVESTALEGAAANAPVLSDGAGNLGVGTADDLGYFRIQNACFTGITDCLAWADNDSTDNCGAATTSFMNTINAKTTPIQIAINGAGLGAGYALKTCNLVFSANSSASGMITVNANATLDAGTNSSANLIQVGDGTHGMVFRWTGGTFVGGASLTVAGIEVKNATANAILSDINWQNFGAGNATLGNCTNYAVQFDNFMFEATLSRNHWTVSDATTGRCFVNNSGGTVGESTLIFSDNTAGGKSGSSCASQLFVDGGWYGIATRNNLGNAGVDIRLQGGGHRVVTNQLDTEGCTAHGVNAPLQFGGASSSANVDGMTIMGNVVQLGSGHATNLFQLAGDSTGTMTATQLIGNTNNTGGGNNGGGLVGGSPSCAASLYPLAACIEYGNVNFTQLTTCGATAAGWMLGDVLASCASSAQTANVSNTLLFTAPNSTNGTIAVIVTCQVMISTAPGTSGTVPQCGVNYTDALTSVVQTVPLSAVAASGAIGCTSTPAFNALPPVGYSCQGTSGIINPKKNTAVNYFTTGYASAGTAMQYQVYVTAKNAD